MSCVIKISVKYMTPKQMWPFHVQKVTPLLEMKESKGREIGKIKIQDTLLVCENVV